MRPSVLEEDLEEWLLLALGQREANQAAHLIVPLSPKHWSK
jgi:hypothetical protein